MDKTLRVAAGLLSLAASFPLEAADYFDDFSTTYPYNTGFELAGQNDWEISDLTTNLTFFVQLNGSMAGAFGDFRNTPFTPFTRLSHPVEKSLDHAFLKTIISLQALSTLQPGERFSLFVSGPQAENILKLDFEHRLGSDNQYDLYWSTGTQPRVDAKLSLIYGAPYTLEIQFPSVWTPERKFKATLSGKNSLSFTGFIPSAPEKSWTEVGFDYISAGATAEKKFLVFDSLRAGNVPLPDTDSDGFRDDCEAFFGTDPVNPASQPRLLITPGLNGDGTTVSFPSVVGNSYLVQSSEDMLTWNSVIVKATANPLVWTDVVPPAAGRKYYRAGNP